MKPQILEAEIVRMRPLESDDIPHILKLASAAEIAENTFVPHPYPPEAAAEFVSKTRERWHYDEGFTFAIIDTSSDAFVGAMGIHPKGEHHAAEVGYWIGKPFWGRGLATAALRRIIQFGFEQLGLNRIQAGHFRHNMASGRVMQKANMRYEGVQRQGMYHREQYKDVVYYAILREDYETRDRYQNTNKTTEKTAKD